MEIQRHGSEHLEIVLDAHSLEDQKQQIAGLGPILQTWKEKCKSAESCSVSLSCEPTQLDELKALAEEAVSSVNDVYGISVKLEEAKGADKSASADSADELAKKKSHLRDLISLATVDGQFDEEESATILGIGLKMGLSERQVNSIYNESVLIPDQIGDVTPDDPQERLEHLANLCKVILADGVIHDWESVLIVPLAVKMGFDSQDVADMLEKLIDEE